MCSFALIKLRFCKRTFATPVACYLLKRGDCLITKLSGLQLFLSRTRMRTARLRLFRLFVVVVLVLPDAHRVHRRLHVQLHVVVQLEVQTAQETAELIPKHATTTAATDLAPTA